MMSRPMVLLILLLILVFTSQFEWKQQLLNELGASPSVSQKQQHISKRGETVKEKIILSQEKNIQKLNELVRSLQEQLLQCKSSNETINDSETPSTKSLNELERKQILED